MFIYGDRDAISRSHIVKEKVSERMEHLSAQCVRDSESSPNRLVPFSVYFLKTTLDQEPVFAGQPL